MAMWTHSLCALLLLEVVEQNSEGIGILTVVGDDSARALDDLLRAAFSVDLAQTAPLTQLQCLGHHDERSLVALAQRAHELGVLGLVAVVSKAAQPGSAAVQGLASLVQTTLEAIVDEGLLQHLLQRRHNVHLSLSLCCLISHGG